MKEAVDWKTEGEAQFEEEGGDLDPEQVRQGQEEEMHYMVKELEMEASKGPTVTKWIDRVMTV